MSNYARGRDVQIFCTVTDSNGQETLLTLGSPVSATFNMESTEGFDQRLGQAESDTEQVITGTSGNIVLKRDTHIIDTITQLLFDAARNRTKTPKFTINRLVFIPETNTTKTLSYPNCVFKINSDNGGREDALQDTIDWMGGFPIYL